MFTMYIRDKKRVDNLVVFTRDKQIDLVTHFVCNYRLQVNPKLLYVTVGLAASRTSDILYFLSGSACETNEDNVFLSGFSDSILRFVAERSGGGRLCHIDFIDSKYNLKPLPKPPRKGALITDVVSLPPVVEGIAIPKWRTIKVFISSTFLDMHGERDLLIRYIFPQLRRRVRSLFLDVHEIDLRWGLTEEEANSDRALEICLGEVSKCHLFIGILGERYGTIPSSYDSCAEKDEFSWLKEYPKDRSITELEFHCGGLRNAKVASGQAFFFLRDATFIQDVPKPFRKHFVESGSRGIAELKQLKERVRRSGLEVFDGYPCEWKGFVDSKPMTANLEEFGMRVLNNLWTALTKLYATDQVVDGGCDDDENGHVAFALRCQEKFVGRQKLIDAFRDAILNSTERKILVSGPHGIGKTAIMGHLGCIFRCDFPVILCFVGATSTTTNVKQTLSYLCDKLRQVVGSNDIDIPDMHRGQSEFVALLSKVGKAVEKLFIFVDGLDTLDEDGLNKSLEWLNLEFPENVVVVCSASVNGHLHKSFSGMAGTTLSVGPMNMSDRMQLARNFLAKHRKSLEEGGFNNQLRSLVSKFESGSPLYMYLACEELRTFGVFEKVSEHIVGMSSSVEGLLKTALSQLENDFGLELVEETIGFLTLCKEGLREEELYQLLGLYRSFLIQNEVQLEDVQRWVLTPDVVVPQLTFFNMIRTIRSILMPDEENMNSPLRVSHRKVVAVLHGRYSKTIFSAASQQKMHRLIAGYFSSLADVRHDGSWRGNNVQALSAVMRHLLASSCFSHAEAALCNLNYIRAKFETGLHHQLLEEYRAVGVVDLLAHRRHADGINRDRLRLFESFVLRNLHVLGETPQLTMQQALNESDGSEVQAAAASALECSEDERRGRGQRVVPVPIRWLNKPNEDDDRCQMTLVFGKEIRTAVCSPNNDLVGVGEANVLRLFSIESGKEIRSFTGHMDTITQVLFLSSTKVCSSSLDTTISIWDIYEGHRISVLRGHTRCVSGLCCDPSGKTLVSVGWDSSLRLWNVSSGLEISTISAKSKWSPFNCVGFHPHRQLAVTGSWDGLIKIWDLIKMKFLKALQGHKSSVRSVDVSLDGVHIVSTSFDFTLRIWSLEHGFQVSHIRSAFPYASAVFSRSGNHIVAGGASRGVKIFSAKMGETLIKVNLVVHGSLRAVCFHPNGSSILCGYANGSLQSVDIFTGRSELLFNTEKDAITCLCFLKNDSSVVIAGMQSGVLNLLDDKGMHLEQLEGHVSAITAMASSADTVVSGSLDGQLICHQFVKGEEVMKPLFAWNDRDGAISSIAFKWDGSQLVTTSADQTAKVWDLQSTADPTVRQSRIGMPEPLLCIRGGHGDTVTSSCWIEDYGKDHILVTASSDLSLKAWKSFDGICVWTKTGFTAPVTFLDSMRTWFVAGCLNGTIEILSSNGIPIATISGSGQSVFGVLFRSADLASEGECYEPTSQIVSTEESEEPLSAIDQLQSAADAVKECLLVRGTPGGVIEVVKPCISQEKEVLFGHSEEVLSVCCSAEGRVVSTSSDKSVRIWKPRTLDGVGTEETANNLCHSAEVTSLSHCRISGHVATGDRNGAVILWRFDLVAIKWLPVARVSEAHKKSVMAIVFCSRNASLFATGSDDTFVKLWKYDANLITGQLEQRQSLLSASSQPKIKSHYSICAVRRFQIGSPVICLTSVLDSNILFIGTTKNRVISLNTESETQSVLKYLKRKDKVDDDSDSSSSSASSAHLLVPNDSSIKSWILHLIAVGEIDALNSKLFLLDSFGNLAFIRLTEDISSLVPETIASVVDLKSHLDDVGLWTIDDKKYAWTTAFEAKIQTSSRTTGNKKSPTFFFGFGSGEVLVYNQAATTKQSIKIPGGTVRGISLREMPSGNSSVICTGSSDGIVRIWTFSTESANLKLIGQFYCKSPITYSTIIPSSPCFGRFETTIVCSDLLGNVYFLTTQNLQDYTGNETP